MSEFKKPSEYPALSKAQKKYDKKTKYLSLRFLEDEMDLYNFVHKQKNTSKYIKDLIRKDINKKQN